MLKSLEDLHECAMNKLKTIRKHELLLDEESVLLHQLVIFLKLFKDLTDLISDANNSLAVIPFMKKRIKDNCTILPDDVTEIKNFKKAVASSINVRLKLSDTAKVACMLDLNVREIFLKDDIAATLKNTLTLNSIGQNDNCSATTSSTAVRSANTESADPAEPVSKKETCEFFKSRFRCSC